jgi:dihydrofolate reductase
VTAKCGSVSSRSIAIVQVAAVATNGVIGKCGRLPWRLKSELMHFRKITMGKPVVMGRRTYLSIGKPLAGRTNVVVSRDANFAAPGVITAANIEAALAVARGDALRRGSDEIVVIGGAEIYRQTMPIADRLVITTVDLQAVGDVRFPPIDANLWTQVSASEHTAAPDDDASFTIRGYERKSAARS